MLLVSVQIEEQLFLFLIVIRLKMKMREKKKIREIGVKERKVLRGMKKKGWMRG